MNKSVDLDNNYRIPLDLSDFFRTGKLKACSIEDSIAAHLHLLLTTMYGEFRFDKEYGCEVWEFEFEHQQTTRIWLSELSKKIETLTEKYESRLVGVKVKAELSQAEFDNGNPYALSKHLKKQLTVHLRARLKSTDESFYFTDRVLLSPFATSLEH